MCRLYGFRATEPTKVECTLVHAQNALIVQSQSDLTGLSHSHGWGVATFEDHVPQIERQAWAAYHGEHFRRAAARIYSETVVAHVRRATVGEPSLANTHPFSDGPWVLVHNGTVPNFEEVKHLMLGSIAPSRRAYIQGTTDSEHVFQFLRTLQEEEPDRPLLNTLRVGIDRIIGWCQKVDQSAKVGLNLIYTDGTRMVGSRVGRSLYYVERDGIKDCQICGFPHVHHDPHRSYQAVVVASEPISDESWTEVPEKSVYEVSANQKIEIQSL